MSKYSEVTQHISKHLPELGKHIPDVMKHFSRLVSAGVQDGALDKKTKELITIGIAVANRCDGCIGFHTKTLVERTRVSRSTRRCNHYGRRPIRYVCR